MPLHRRTVLIATLTALWLTGCLWLLLDQFFQTHGEFGPVPNHWQPPLLLVHGIVAIGSLYLLGWISAKHVLRWWPGRLRRVSGGILTTFFGALTLSGFALFFLSDDYWQRLAAVSHDVMGVGVTGFAVYHWFIARRRPLSAAAARTL